VIRSFRDKGTEAIFHGGGGKPARRTLPEELHERAHMRLDRINAARTLDDLRLPPSHALEKLAGDRQGQHSIRINRQYQICFRWTDEGAEDVEIVDYH
jgi:proteic killer suppression protein